MNKQQKQERALHIVGAAIVIICAVMFTLYGFFIPQTCDIDKQYLYCHLHPASFISIFGCVLFYSAIAVLAGVTKLFKVNFTGGMGFVAALVAVAGIVLVWNA